MSGMEWFPLLGLANRARKVVSGEDLVIKEIRNARAKLVLLTEDASANTAKKYPINAIIIKCLIKKSKAARISAALSARNHVSLSPSLTKVLRIS